METSFFQIGYLFPHTDLIILVILMLNLSDVGVYVTKVVINRTAQFTGLPISVIINSCCRSMKVVDCKLDCNLVLQ